MRPVEVIWDTPDLIIGDGVSNIINGFGYGWLVCFFVAHSLDATPCPFEFLLDLIEGSRMESAQEH